MERIYTVTLNNGASYQARADEALGLKRHDICIIHKDFYVDWGTVTRICNELEPGKGAEIPQITGIATQEELKTISSNRDREQNALKSAKEAVERLGLPMKLLNSHYSLDLKFMAIQFTADGRVDFRELVKELSHTLNTRIELRQIGVRDESAIHGGISVCGQVLCCCRFLKEFNSINVRMAKEQDLSLTPATISGVCGRLKCCLKFEHEGYLELEKTMPRRGEWCDIPAGHGRICDRNLLTQEVTVQLENGSQVRCSVNDITLTPPDRRPARNQQPGKTADNRNPSGKKQDSASNSGKN